jgi:acetyl esterase
MPLDPHLAGVLQMMASASAGAKPLHEGSPQEGRAMYLASTAGALTPQQVIPVASVQATTVPGAAGPLAARIYRPEGEGPFPTVAFFHGGGYVIGDLDTHDNVCRAICRGAAAMGHGSGSGLQACAGVPIPCRARGCHRRHALGRRPGA